MKVQVKKRGNGASIRLPISVMTAAALSVGQMADVRAEGGRIIIEPIMALAYDLDKLLAEMKPESFPENIDFGSPVGRETSLDL